MSSTRFQGGRLLAQTPGSTKKRPVFTKTSRLRTNGSIRGYFAPKRGLEDVAAGRGFDPMCFRPLLLPLSLNPSDLQTSNTE
jgi:hypothetical protein